MLSRGRLIFLSLSLVTVLLVAGGRMLAESNRQQDPGEDSLYKYLSVFTEVFSLVNRTYVDELDDAELMAGAVEGSLDALDPFALYIPKDAMSLYDTVRQVGVTHSGILVLKQRGVAYVAAVEEGSPAALAGIGRDHIFSEIEGQLTRRMPLLEIQALLAGPPGTEITVERIYQGQKETVSFTLAEYPRPGIELTAQRGVPVLRLPGFYGSLPTDVAASLATVGKGAAAPGGAEHPLLGEITAPDKLIVDLRGVVGGDEALAYRVAGLFASGEAGVLIRRDGPVETFASSAPPQWQGKIVVLVDRSTQGPAEVLATALRQAAGATLVGEGTFGHAGRPGVVELASGDRLLLTDAFYTGPDHKPIQSSLEPDVWVRPSFGFDDVAEPEGDEALERGLRVLLGEEEVEKRQAA